MQLKFRKINLAFSWLILLIIGVPNSAYATQLRLASWNLAWLSSHSYPQFTQSQRHLDDFNALSKYFTKIQPDLLAFQEVNDVAAIQQVVGSNYQIILSERALSRNAATQFSDINQYTGFAIDKSITVVEHPDLNLNSNKNGKLRFATYIELKPTKNAKGIHILSVHLKAGCIGKRTKQRSCKLLATQGKKLNQWIKQRESLAQSYIILGDFNHDLAFKGDWLWQALTHQVHNVRLATQYSTAQCVIRSNRHPKQTHQFKRLIDHAMVSGDLHFSRPKQHLYSKQDLLNYQLSDHCPMSFTIKEAL
ncbi:endonuclease/exonuclease/phosphatase family protein [Vibrio rarus]|uniref:endonuclease/exonuclease/phosphatase family protein n=1 Tax=Vibrio rarus TaxID=413403 RepID=UPI0021C30B82|nr:endonuclease/exonuclease/phosphatase family protein [Vibrio rarus]